VYHNLQQAQQLLNTIDQMASQMRQQEASNQQMLGQMEQRENQAAQRLQQIQQMCQECSRVLQSHQNAYHQNYFATAPLQGSYQQEIAAPMGFSSMGYQAAGVNLGQPQNIGTSLQTNAPLIDPTSMGASTYYDSLRQFGGQGNQAIYTPGGIPGMQSSFTAASGFSPQTSIGLSGQMTPGFSRSGLQSAGVSLGQTQNAGALLQTQAPLVDPTTMSASTYYDSQRQFGMSSGNQALYSTGGVSGLQTTGTFGSTGQGGVFGTQGIPSFAGQGSTSGINMEISSLPTQTPFASTATMGPEKYQSAVQKMGGTGLSMSTVGQQSGIATR